MKFLSFVNSNSKTGPVLASMILQTVSSYKIITNPLPVMTWEVWECA